MRFILFVIVGYILWRLVQMVVRIMGNRRNRHDNDIFESSQNRSSPAQKFSDIKDADFEDITPKEKNDEKTKPSAP